MSEENWLIMVRAVKLVLPPDSRIGRWDPVETYKSTVYYPRSEDMDDRVVFAQLCTIYRDDWAKIWTLMGWSMSRRTRRTIVEFRQRCSIRPRPDMSTKFFCLV